MEPVSSNPIRLTERDQEQREEQLRIQREEESRTVEIIHPRTRIQGVLLQNIRYPSLMPIAFLGIPYALPPVGERRFQPPERLPQVPHDHPTPLFLANKASHPCTQKYMDRNIGSEDCLYLNVFTPREPKDIRELLPVLVYIHGGGFTVGEKNLVDPQNLLREDLIVVVINYRLGIYGFLNMRTENCLGNTGLKDQVMALEWVRDNIEQFKGNPKNVTICGQSAGGTCVNLHMLSPLSKGLFHKAIVMGAGIYSPWGNGGHAKYVKQLFKDATGKSKEPTPAVVDILKQKETFDLMKLGEETVKAYLGKLHPMILTSLFKPSVECVREGAFLPDPVEKLMEVAEPVPTIAGITKQEGYTYFAAQTQILVHFMKGNIKFVELVKDIIRHNFCWKDTTAVDRHFGFFKNMYFPEDWMLEEGETVKDDEENRPTTEEEKQRKDEEKQRREEERKHRLATLLTDIAFRRFYDNFKIGNLLDEGEPPFYVYEFDYYAGQPIFSFPTWEDDHHVTKPVIEYRAANHADDYYYLFAPNHVDRMLKRIAKKDYDRVRLEIEDVQINMSSLWSSFCRTGYPKSRAEGDANMEWARHTEQAPHFLQIGKELKLKDGRLNKERWAALNAICQSEPTIPSLAVTPRTSPQTPKKECPVFQLSQLKLDSSSTQAPDTEYETFQRSQPKPDQSTSQTSAEEVECDSTYEILSNFLRVTEYL